MTAALIIIAFTSSGSVGTTGPTRELARPTAHQASHGALMSGRYTSSRKCSAHKAVRFYSRRLNEHRARMGRGSLGAESRRGNLGRSARDVAPCPRYLAHVLQRKARAWRFRAEAWVEYHYAWSSWLPDKWQRIGACETGYGRRPGRWDWNSGTYQGAFGFYHGSWDAFVPRADRKAGPYPSEAYLATPRQQYEVALAIWRAYGFSGWGCRGA